MSLVTVNGSLCSNYLAHIGLRGRSPAVVQARRRVVIARVAPDSATNVSQIIRTITARDLLAGDLGAHRALAVDPQQPAPEPPPAVPPPRAVYSRRDREQAWQRRRADLEDRSTIS